MNSAKKQFLFLALLFFLFPNCEEQFNFERPDSIKEAISIQGKLVKGNPSTVKVTIREVFDFFQTARFLTASEVLLIDEADNQVKLKTRQEGFFNLEIPEDHPTFKVEYGRKYKIRISGLKNRIFESEFDELLPAPKPDNFIVKETTKEFTNEFGKISTFEQLGFYVSSPLKADNATQNSRLLFETVGVARVTDTPNAGRCRVRREPEPKSCYAEYSPVENYLTFDGSAASGDRFDDFLVNTSNFTSLYAEGYYMTLLQQSLSENALNYWSQVNTVVNRTKDVFQEPAGVILSNITDVATTEEKIYGFFYATEEHILRVYISPEFGRNQNKQCPITSDTGDLAAFCCNCLNLPNSTRVKPDWWVD